MTQTMKIVIGAIIVAIVAYVAFVFDVPYGERVDDFATCVAAGNPVMESYPRQCRDKDGNLYVEVVPKPSVSDLIQVDSPASGATVTSPVSVAGQARGNWYFEASFPVFVMSADGKVLGQAPVQAQGEWMTTEFVPFNASIPFDQGTSTSGFIRFHNDNPSGDPERDLYIDVPVTFGKPGATSTQALCRPTGCSGQICSDQDMASTCEYRSEYACYKTAKCERQPSGACGWTPTPSLTACLANPPETI